MKCTVVNISFPLKAKASLPELKFIIQYLPESIQPLTQRQKEAGVMSWDQFIELGKVKNNKIISFIIIV